MIFIIIQKSCILLCHCIVEHWIMTSTMYYNVIHPQEICNNNKNFINYLSDSQSLSYSTTKKNYKLIFFVGNDFIKNYHYKFKKSLFVMILHKKIVVVLFLNLLLLLLSLKRDLNISNEMWLNNYFICKFIIIIIIIIAKIIIIIIIREIMLQCESIHI